MNIQSRKGDNGADGRITKACDVRLQLVVENNNWPISPILWHSHSHYSQTLFHFNQQSPNILISEWSGLIASQLKPLYKWLLSQNALIGKSQQWFSCMAETEASNHEFLPFRKASSPVEPPGRWALLRPPTADRWNVCEERKLFSKQRGTVHTLYTVSLHLNHTAD